MTRVAIFWQSLPSYLATCIATLAQQEGVQILAYWRAEGPFANVVEPLRQYANVHLLEKGSPERVLAAGSNFNPHLAVLTITRWGLFARLASAWRRAGAMVIAASDHFWKGDWRDYANSLVGRLGGFSAYEAVLVPGALGKIYARRLGFSEPAIFDGLYTCDTRIFRPIGTSRHQGQTRKGWPRVFLFVGQFIRRKGLDILLRAYQAYRRQAARPWELWLIGKGELEQMIGTAPGVRNLGEKTSSQIADLMLQAGCLVLPSREDHWGLVIHEAANAGLPILASARCGSAPELVQSGFNGYVFPANDETRLARLLLFMDEGGLAPEMGKNSWQLAARFSPELWARKLLVDIPLCLRGQPLQASAWNIGIQPQFGCRHGSDRNHD